VVWGDATDFGERKRLRRCVMLTLVHDNKINVRGEHE
jgi:hypothetical protein